MVVVLMYKLKKLYVDIRLYAVQISVGTKMRRLGFLCA